MLSLSMAALLAGVFSLSLAATACWLGLRLLAAHRRESRLQERLTALRSTPRTQRQRAVSTRLADEIAQRRTAMRQTLDDHDGWWTARALPRPEVVEWPATQPLFPDTDVMPRLAA